MRRISLSPALHRLLAERAAKKRSSVLAEVEHLIRLGLSYEEFPPPPDTPLERRVRALLSADPNLTRAAATRIARAGNHDRP